MFSYGSNKNSKSTIENELIQEIQYIGNQIFDMHLESVTRTELQQMSLQLSPTTSQSQFQIKPNLQNQHHPQSNYFTNIIQNQKPFHHLLHKNINQNSYIQSSQINQHQILSKSLLSNHHKREPGSFSNNYLSGSQINPSKIFNQKNSGHQKLNINQSKILEKQKLVIKESEPLKSSNMNKSNILIGILKQNQHQKSKTPIKKGKFSNSYASNYLSPYSSKAIKENSKSYMQKSNSQIKKAKQTIQIQYIKQRINENIQPQVSYRKQKTERQKSNNSKMSHVKSKYKQIRPLMHQYELYANQHIYKKIHTQMASYQQKKKYYQNFSDQQIQNNWKRFIQNQERFLQNKKQWITARRFQKLSQQKANFSPLPIKNTKNDNLKIIPPKMTPQDFVKKYKRQKDKLKEKLQANQITNFLTKSYQDSSKYGKQIFDTAWGTNSVYSKALQNKNNKIQVKNTSQNIQQDQISKLLISNIDHKAKNFHENFFISVGQQNSQNHTKPNANIQKQIIQSHKNKKLSKSLINQQRLNNSQKQTQGQLKSSTRMAESSIKKQEIRNLSPFIKRSVYFSRQQKQSPDVGFISHRNNLAQFNDQVKRVRSKIRQNKSFKKQEEKLKELSNPKYFKSINQLEEYSSNKKSQKDKSKRSFVNNKFQSIQKSKAIKTQSNDYNSSKIKNKLQTNKVTDISKFDKNLMSKIIQDLNHMKSQMEENKKKRKYKIQNYRNFSNIRTITENEHQECRKNNKNISYQYSDDQKIYMQDQVKEKRENLQKKQQNIMRTNNHFHYENERQLDGKIHDLDLVLRSRSVSPIQQQDSIINENHTLSLSIIQQGEETNNINDVRKTNNQPFSSRINNSKVIMVKSRQQIQFILQNHITQ